MDEQSAAHERHIHGNQAELSGQQGGLAHNEANGGGQRDKFGVGVGSQTPLPARFFVEKKAAYATEAMRIAEDLRSHFGLGKLVKLRIINRYDCEGAAAETLERAALQVFSEPPVDLFYTESPDLAGADYVLAVEALPGQYDQRADFTAQCLQILGGGERPLVSCAKLYVFYGEFGEEEQKTIRRYLINPVEAREASLVLPETLRRAAPIPADIQSLDELSEADDAQLDDLRCKLGLAMTRADLKFIQEYFECADRSPTLTEIRVLDTYWSDHCRHTTFNTALESIRFKHDREKDAGASAIQEAMTASLDMFFHERRRHLEYQHRLNKQPDERNRVPVCEMSDEGAEDEAGKRPGDWPYTEPRQNAEPRQSAELRQDGENAPCLMELATLAAKRLRETAYLNDQDISEEINACSIEVTAAVEGRTVPLLLMFKNETHNHPTEIEPFGGAATCLGGAIRDPLSGRSYVYQSMRITGSGDPRQPVEETLQGKLPQRKITTGAAAGFSAYGNEIGLAAGQIHEIYHPGYIAKRMEIGAVIAAVPADQVVRERPEAGDVVVLLGGRTGRDGIGGATGSSKSHDSHSVETAGSEVQKGNPLTERALQRLFRRPEISRLIRRCNDFGAGGVCVAIGELAPGLDINLDKIPVKYDGLDATELAISESQERMAVVLREEVSAHFIQAAAEENLEANVVARVTDDRRMVMRWHGHKIVDLERAFVDTNGAPQKAEAILTTPVMAKSSRYFRPFAPEKSFARRLKTALSDLSEAGQKGLVERFDNSIGAGTILHPFGGPHQLTPEQGMAARVPMPDGEADLASLMSFGFDPWLSDWSPYHGAYFAVAEALAKITAMGASPQKAHLTFQEYFPRTSNPELWGKPLAALLGAFQAQMDFKVAAIGGKDSMSGTFNDLTVPPTLVCFAVATRRFDEVHSCVLSQSGKALYFFPLPLGKGDLLDGNRFMANLNLCHRLQKSGALGAMAVTGRTGSAATVTKLCFGAHMGFSFDATVEEDLLFTPQPGALVMEIGDERLGSETEATLLAAGACYLGRVSSTPIISFRETAVNLDEAIASWLEPLEGVFPSGLQDRKEQKTQEPPTLPLRPHGVEKRSVGRTEGRKRAPAFPAGTKPRVLIPVFPGTNCEYDSARAFSRAGAEPHILVFRNKTPRELAESLEQLAEEILLAQILMLPGGFSAGDEPDGSGKFIAAVFRSPRVAAATMSLLKEHDGLVLGICNGFQALLKLGLLPYGEIRPLESDSPMLTFNRIGRHVATYIRTKICSVMSPWLMNCAAGDCHVIPVSHGEGRFTASEAWLGRLAAAGQIATQYVDFSDQATLLTPYNPNGSDWAVEGMTSSDGRILGKMGHSERVGRKTACNIPGNKEQGLFAAGVRYFTEL